MRSVQRTRHYVSPGALMLCRPVFSFDYGREAYTLRGIGNHIGPVLRENRRRRRSSKSGSYKGPERRGTSHAHRAGSSARNGAFHQPVSEPHPAPSRQTRSNRQSGSRRKAASGRPSGATLQRVPAAEPGAGGQERSDRQVGMGGQGRAQGQPGAGGQGRPDRQAGASDQRRSDRQTGAKAPRD